jgi:transcriptional regulator with XRE-family HTH domain
MIGPFMMSDCLQRCKDGFRERATGRGDAMARVRMRDVAEHAGVSVRTVSNVVSGYTHVSPATRARVQRSLDELGYRMDYLARGLRSGRTGFVALAVPFLAEPYFAELAQAVVRPPRGAASRCWWSPPAATARWSGASCPAA